MEILKWIIANWVEVLGGIIGVLSALIALFLLIPGAEPERTLQKILNFLTKFSRKKS